MITDHILIEQQLEQLTNPTIGAIRKLKTEQTILQFVFHFVNY